MIWSMRTNEHTHTGEKLTVSPLPIVTDFRKQWNEKKRAEPETRDHEIPTICHLTR